MLCIRAQALAANSQWATTPSLTSIGLSALRAAQASLSTTGNNIANVNTDGYSRQRVELATAGSQDLVGFSFGTGVQIQAVSRFADQTVNKQLLVQTSNAGDASKFLEFVSLIDNLLADPNAGLSPAVDGFFASMQDLAGDPASPLHRQVLLTEANTLSQRFRLIDERLSEVDDRVNSTVRASVTEINSLAESIGDLNGPHHRVAGAFRATQRIARSA